MIQTTETYYPLAFMPNFSEKIIHLDAYKKVTVKGPFDDLILEKSTWDFPLSLHIACIYCPWKFIKLDK